ncbi:MAG: hypothetical protein ABMA13_17505 [Chthoniobacteraceae bacterium]
MPEPDSILDAEFDAQLRGLFAQAEKAMESRDAAAPPTAKSAPTPEPLSAGKPGEPEPVQAPPEPLPPQATQLSLTDLLKPLALGLESVSRATGENSASLKRIESGAAEAGQAQKELPAVVHDLRAMLDARNLVSQGMFAALHEELKGYKDRFLLDSVHRPIIRDLISLYDDVAGIQRQLATALATDADTQLCPASVEMIAKLRTIEVNLDHHLGFITEVLNRFEVALMPPHTGKLDKQTQRAVAVEPAEDPDDESLVVRAVKRGFLWKDRLFRAEEVVIKRWKEGFLVARTPTDQK